MRQLIAILFVGILVCLASAAHAQTFSVDHFHKVIISPYIQATFVQGDEESVTINSTIVDSNKLRIEVQHGTLRVYLDGAKDIPNYQRDYESDGNPHNYPIYPNHAVLVTITYRKLDDLSLRGTEKYLCLSPLSVNTFSLHVYGEATVIFTEVHIGRMHTHLYGESSLDVRSGEVNRQYYTCFGDGKINTTAIAGRAAKVTAFGEAEFKVNVSDRIKVTAFGEAKLRYLGNPTIVKGIHLGNVDVQKLN